MVQVQYLGLPRAGSNPMFPANRSSVPLLADMGISPLLSSNPATGCQHADVPCGSARQLGSHGGGSLAQRTPEQLHPDLPMTLLACPTTRPVRPTSGKWFTCPKSGLGRGELSSWPEMGTWEGSPGGCGLLIERRAESFQEVRAWG